MLRPVVIIGLFQSTPPRGGRPRMLAGQIASTKFQSTPPRGGRHGISLLLYHLRQFQSTPPRGGRRFDLHRSGDSLTVSIHAPARGATDSCCVSISRTLGFNPRPRAGGDGACRNSRSIDGGMFQSTPPRGGRLQALRTSGNADGVSIHAPARGATTAYSLICSIFDRFNPRPRAGGDVDGALNELIETEVSIHAPARGATTLTGVTDAKQNKFQSTPPRGGRHRRLAVIDPEMVSIHAPARGATLKTAGRDRVHAICFNPRPRAGGDNPPS